MELDKPQLFFGRVAHGRLFPKRNNFTYGIYYLTLPLSSLSDLPIAYNRFAPLSFHDRDHANRDGGNLEKWARDLLAQHNINKANGAITLICMPRIFGYVFNPVSFWLCHDMDGKLRAVLCEVNNTFGESHTYLCAHNDQRPIDKKDVLTGKKIFHVSPFLKREGHYEFRFDVTDKKFKTFIDFHDKSGKKQLVTSLIGHFSPMNKKNLRTAFWRYPLVTFKSIILIHWQAVKLISKGIKYISKPIQKTERISRTDNKKM